MRFCNDPAQHLVIAWGFAHVPSLAHPLQKGAVQRYPLHAWTNNPRHLVGLVHLSATTRAPSSATAEVRAEPEVMTMKTMMRLAWVSLAVLTWTTACTTTTPSNDDDEDNEGGAGGTTPTPPPTTPPTTPPPTPPPSMGGICDSGLTSGSDGEDACLSASCCDAFNACTADTTCNGCLTNAMAPGCDSNTLLDTFNSCSDANCKTNVCDDGITFSDQNGDPAFACISCASETAACCTALDTCVGTGSQADVNNCLTCLNDDEINKFDPAVPTSGDCFDLGAGIPEAAQQFQQCLQDNCATDCGIAAP